MDLSVDVIVAILIVAIVANLVITVGLLVALVRRGRAPRAIAAPMVASRPERETAVSVGEPALDTEEVEPMRPEPEPAYEGGVVSILTDPLTGLDNRLAWDRLLREENARKRRYGRPVSLVIAELYGLDALADLVGREAADKLVPAIAEALTRYGRAPDRVARVGHARFHILLPETDEVRAINYIERVRQACDLWLEAGAVALNLSLGWASPGPDDDLETAMVTAEDRLLAAHRRNSRRATG